VDLQRALAILSLRLYEWSTGDFLRELSTGCPLLSRVGQHNRRVGGFISWVRTLPADARDSMARSLLRRAHEEAAALKEETVTQMDRNWYQKFYEQTTIHMEALPPLVTADPNLPTFEDANPDECLDLLFSSLPSTMGSASRRRSAVRCSRRIGEWTLATDFTFLRRDRYLAFEHEIRRKDQPLVWGIDAPFARASLLFFYGISESAVVVGSRADSALMAPAMVRLADHFVSQADSLFAAIGVAD